ncbi:MAG: potassium transporter Kup [Candidatus Binatia bacterium]|nr:potassium transporter Kup [Candidatus Binatia bacterium]
MSDTTSGASDKSKGTPAAAPPGTSAPKDLSLLALGALGIVYGDIGTSPIYAFRQCFTGPRAISPTPEDVLGVISLILWALLLVVSFKYLHFVMRADNQGEGGILALLALILPKSEAARSRTGVLAGLGLFGAALLYGDGAITPAISVLSAVEGLGIATDRFDPLIVPITVLILLGLFQVQRHGTARVSAIFGPAMLVWFLTIGGLGALQLIRDSGAHTSVWLAIDPTHAIGFFGRHGTDAFLTLGSVVLVVTGSEALYADMGHFGARPIRTAWYVIVLPCLALNYLGQASLVLESGRMGEHPFYDLAPDFFLYPLIAIATLATVIASQALISGAFSLTQQAVQLDFLPRLRVVHTSDTARGQIYMPAVNTALTILCIGIVLGFRSSEALAGAYGIAVTGTMSVTSILFFVAARRRWGWSWLAAAVPVALFLLFDLSFLGANLVKIDSGGWVPIAIAIGVFVILTTWKRGRQLLLTRQSEWAEPVDEFLADAKEHTVVRVPGTAVYLSSETEQIPPVLLHNFLANRVLHERVILVSALGAERPWVSAQERATVVELGQGLYRAVALFGFQETPRIETILHACAIKGLVVDIDTGLFFFSRFTALPTGHGGMARWRKKLFSFLARNAPSLTSSFRIPPARVVEIGAQVEI